jgi:hypothetical protein
MNMETIRISNVPARRLESALILLGIIAAVVCLFRPAVNMVNRYFAAGPQPTFDKIYADGTFAGSAIPTMGQFGYPALSAKAGQSLQIRGGNYVGGKGGDASETSRAGDGGPALRIPGGANVDLCGGRFIGGFGGSGAGASGPGILIDGGTLIVHGSNLSLTPIESSDYCLLSGIYANSQPFLMSIERAHGGRVVLAR